MKNRGYNKSAHVLLNLVNKFRAYPAISNCSHLLLKCRVAANMLLAKSTVWVVQNLHICKKVNFYQYIAFIIPSHFNIVPYLTLWMLDFTIPSGCQTVWIPIRPDILLVPDLGPN